MDCKWWVILNIQVFILTHFSRERKVTDQDFIYGVVCSNGYKVFVYSAGSERDFGA